MSHRRRWCRASGPCEGVSTPVAYYCVTPEGVLSEPTPIDVQAPQMMHDFAITGKYAVFMDHALVFDGAAMVKKKQLPFVTDLSRPSRLGLLQRAAPHKGVHWLPVDPFVCLHTANAWDDGDKVHLLACRFGPSPVQPVHCACSLHKPVACPWQPVVCACPLCKCASSVPVDC
jgi:carotenoid cleavage dioxygenase-like enzyme